MSHWRVITAQQLSQGYEVFRPDGTVTHHEYVVLERRTDGIVVVEPQAIEPPDAVDHSRENYG